MPKVARLVGAVLTQVRVLCLRAAGHDIRVAFGSTIHRSATVSARRGRIRIGAKTHLLPGSSIICGRGSFSAGDNMLLGTGALIGTGNGNMTVGSNIFIGPYCVIGGGGDLSIGSDVMIATHSRIMSSEHVIDDSTQSIWAIAIKGVRIGSGVWLGAGVTVLDGSDLADGTVVGAGAVIRAKTDANSIYVGIPARKLRERRLAAHDATPEGPRPQD